MLYLNSFKFSDYKVMNFTVKEKKLCKTLNAPPPQGSLFRPLFLLASSHGDLAQNWALNPNYIVLNPKSLDLIPEIHTSVFKGLSDTFHFSISSANIS